MNKPQRHRGTEKDKGKETTESAKSAEKSNFDFEFLALLALLAVHRFSPASASLRLCGSFFIPHAFASFSSLARLAAALSASRTEASFSARSSSTDLIFCRAAPCQSVRSTRVPAFS